jgi:hypothetical protein
VRSGLGNLPTFCSRDPGSERWALRQAVLDRIAARKADPAFEAAVRRAVKANQWVFERLAQT